MAAQNNDGIIYVQTSVGEFLDKLTILRIKMERISDPHKRQNVQTELSTLEHTWAQYHQAELQLEDDIAQLKTVNEALWDIEERIRIKESKQQFDSEFIELARSVYKTNDERARIKKQINLKSDSQLLEEKSYAGS